MAAAVLFLESESGHADAVSVVTAVDTAKKLIQTLRQVRRVNQRISLNAVTNIASCQLAPGYTMGMLLGGNQFREEWQFLRTLVSQSPLSSGLEDLLSEAALLEVTSAGGHRSAALSWAHIMETGTVSFHVKPEWQNPWIDADCLSLISDGTFEAVRSRIPNSSSNVHVEEHATWLRTLGIESLPTSREFWTERALRYPGLRLLGRVEKQIDDLASSGAPYRLALSSLEALSNDAARWNGVGLPQYSIKVAEGEHDQRRNLAMFEDEQTGGTHSFDKHAYFTGGTAGRIHFRIDTQERKFVVAHVGFKL